VDKTDQTWEKLILFNAILKQIWIVRNKNRIKISLVSWVWPEQG